MMQLASISSDLPYENLKVATLAKWTLNTIRWMNASNRASTDQIIHILFVFVADTWVGVIG
jgi:hypothetical protein